VIVLHPDRPEAVTAGDDGLVRWRLDADGATEEGRRPGRAVGLWAADDPDLVGVAHARGGGRLALALHRRDTLDEVRAVAEIADETEPVQVAGSPDGRWVVVAGIASVLHVVDTRTGAVRNVDGGGMEVTGLRFTPDGGALLAGWGSQGCGGVRSWRMADDGLAEDEPEQLSQEDDCCVRLAVDPWGTRVAAWLGFGFDRFGFAGDEDPVLRLLYLPHGERRWSRHIGLDDFAAAPDTCLTSDSPEVSFTVDGRCVLAGTAGGRVLVFDAGDGRIRHSLPTGADAMVDAVVPDPDGRRVWALAGGRLALAVLPPPGGAPTG
jgi:WD40 repeat protein